MKAGDLVKVKRSSIGVPAGTIGLIVGSYGVSGDYDTAPGQMIHILQLIGAKPLNGRRYLGRDLEIVS